VFLSGWAQLPDLGEAKSDIDWKTLIDLRSDVARELEQLRTQGTIGAPLDAEVDVYCTPEQFDRFNALGEELRFLFITSSARVERVSQAPDGAVAAPTAAKSGVWIRVRPSEAPKCVRCWHHREDVGSNARHPELCARCVSNVDGPGEPRYFV
jgi:isoleucyl-tRNA synthetase